MRLFVAVPLPRDVRHRLAARVAAVGGVDEAIRWVSREHLHLTLKFLGDVPADAIEPIARGIEEACRGARPFPIAVTGFGAFPPGRPPRVLWAGLETAPPLELLQDGVERRMADLGFSLEGEPFRPHVTVGRVRRGRSAGRTTARLLAAEHADAFVVEQVSVMESLLETATPRYAVRHVVRLGS